MVRPGRSGQAQPLSFEALAAIASTLEGEVEVIASCKHPRQVAAAADDATLVSMLARRPMTAADLAGVLGLPLPLVQGRLQRLKEAGQISCNYFHNEDFYQVPTPG